MNLRIILTSARTLDVVVAALAGVALALAFPKANLPWLAPLGAAALFWLWHTPSWKRAFLLGWFAGTIFFAISFSWFGYTIGSYLGPWAPAVVIGPAIVEGLFIGLAGIAASFAFRRAPAALAPLAAAAAFPVFEWLRSIGWTALPFAQLGYSQADTPLALFAAYLGTYGVTFFVCAIGAYAANAIATRKGWRFFGFAIAFVAVWFLCFALWPARQLPPYEGMTFNPINHRLLSEAVSTIRPTSPAERARNRARGPLRIAIVQSNIRQSLKWDARGLLLAIRRSTNMAASAADYQPDLIVFPETVIPEPLNRDPATEIRFEHLAKALQATLVIGAQEVSSSNDWYNALYIFTPQGTIANIYRKRQLVPFAESLPARRFLGWVPYVSQLAGNFSNGTVDGVYSVDISPRTRYVSRSQIPNDIPTRFGPLICWESAFADLAYAQIRRGAQFFIVATDDAWFGETAGPLMHAQISQLRAIETGRWIVRAAATGISGIIRPDGTYVSHANLDEQRTLLGTLGPPTGSLFAHIGPTLIAAFFALLYAVLTLLGMLLSRISKNGATENRA